MVAWVPPELFAPSGTFGLPGEDVSDAAGELEAWREAAALSGLAERSFKRRFAKATGVAPLEYVHTLRLEEAKHSLEKSDAPIEQIANEVGYEDASFFGRLFRRKVGLTPAQYRKRFRSLRHALSATSAG